MFPKIAILFVLLVIGSCGSSETASETPEIINDIAFTTILSDGHSNVKKATSLLITSQTQLETIFNTINSTRKPGFPVPQVDFTNKEVFFYTPGEINHGVNGIKVKHIFVRDQKLVVALKPEKQDPNGYATTVMSQPCVMIVYDSVRLPVVVEMAKR